MMRRVNELRCWFSTTSAPQICPNINININQYCPQIKWFWTVFFELSRTQLTDEQTGWWTSPYHNKDGRIKVVILYHVWFEKLIRVSWWCFLHHYPKLRTIKGYLGRLHEDVVKWKHFPHYCPFVRGIHRSPFDSPHKGQWRGALMFSLICAWTNGFANNRYASDLRRHRAHYDATVMW